MVQCIKVITLLVLLFSSSFIRETKGAAISTAFKMIELSRYILETIDKHDADKEIISQLKYLSKKSDVLADNVATMMDEKTKEIIQNVPGLVEINRRLSKIYLNTLSIQESYETFLLYVQDLEKYNDNIVKDFAFKIISDDNNGMDHLLNGIQGLMIKSDMTTLSTIDLLNKHMEVFLRYINVSKSHQQFFADLFDSIMYTELKGRLTILFSYKILEKYQPGKYEGHIEKSKNNFIVRINETISAFKTIMISASREIWRNDPATHKKDTTYTELEHVFQEYIINEYDISVADNCQHKCSDYKVLEGKLDYSCYYGSEICTHQRICNGYLYNCRKQFSSTISICPSQNIPCSVDNINRRYQYIESDGERYGPNGERCSRNMIQTGHHYLVPFASCSSCMCTCDDIDDEYSERFFNLESSMARIKDNYVITGARFVKRNRVIHIQIEEGQLLPDRSINQSTVVWAPINDKPERLYKLSWNESRGINLDDLHAPGNHVLVGLSFHNKSFETKFKRLHLKIFSLPINFTDDSDCYIQEIVSQSSSAEINLTNLDVPTRSTVENNIRSQQNQYLKFTSSDLEHDVGQSTIPFIDIQEIITNPRMPMSGAGIYHKSRRYSGGFIALKLFTFNLEPYLGLNLDKIEDPSSITRSAMSKKMPNNITCKIISNTINVPKFPKTDSLPNDEEFIKPLSSRAIRVNHNDCLGNTILVLTLGILLYGNKYITIC